MVAATDEFLSVCQNCFAWCQKDDLIVRRNAIPIEAILLECFGSWDGMLGFVSTPNMSHVRLAPNVVKEVIVLRRLFSEKPFAEGYVVA